MSATPGRNRTVRGDDLFYRFFREALEGDPELYAAVPQLLVSTTGIWLPLDVYQSWPVMLPWVVRDSSCRGNRRTGQPDQWASPHPDTGLLRDDNSMIKALPR